MAYAPGSFTKNFAWHGRGFSKLHEAIRAGFSKKLLPVTRTDWRRKSLLSSSDFYIAANFFLFNEITANTNMIPIDELVFQAVSENHSVAFDRLALFALNLSLGGKGRALTTEWNTLPDGRTNLSASCSGSQAAGNGAPSKLTPWTLSSVAASRA